MATQPNTIEKTVSTLIRERKRLEHQIALILLEDGLTEDEAEVKAADSEDRRDEIEKELAEIRPASLEEAADLLGLVLRILDAGFMEDKREFAMLRHVKQYLYTTHDCAAWAKKAQSPLGVVHG